ncbi:MAG TPA: peptidase inhibitor family I36 protein [Sporichthyaceae bacterium]|nr:peptidase inhibitor family I36 protein [Sporichthyaceae bacterium]
MWSRVAVLVAAVPLLLPFAAASAVLPAAAASTVAPKAHDNKGHDNNGQCPRGKLCVWTGPKFSGQRTVFADQADLGGRCRAMHAPIGSVANRTGHSAFPLHLFLFRGNYPTPCDVAGIYAQYVPGQTDAAVPDGPVSGVRIYADPQTGGAAGGHPGDHRYVRHHYRHHRHGHHHR